MTKYLSIWRETDLPRSSPEAMVWGGFPPGNWPILKLLLPNSFNFVPKITVGFKPALIKIKAIIATVVLLPWVPETAIVKYPFVISPRARG